MSFLRNTPIKRKLLWITLTTCVVALGMACGALFWFESVNFRRNFVTELQSLGAVVAQNSAAPLAFDDRKSAVEVLSALRVKPHITGAWVLDSQGNPFAYFGSEDETKIPTRQGEPDQVTFDKGYAELNLPVVVQDGKPGHLYLHARFQDKYRELLYVYATVLAAVLVGSLLVILLITSAMQGIITRPIAALAEVARNVSENEDYVTRAPEAGLDEVGQLTRTFNQMLDQIQLRETRLQESQQRYKVAVMGSSDGLWDWDLVTQSVYFAPRWKSMLGYGEDEVANSFDAFRRLVHPQDVQHMLDRVDAYLKGAEPAYEVEFRARHKDGQYRWILSRGAALRDEQGKPVRFAGSHTDITQRKEADEEIRLARQKFESLVNSIHGIVWEADPVTLRTLFVSAQAESMLGYPLNLWLEDPEFRKKAIHPEDLASTLEALKEGIAVGKPFPLEYRVIAADGRTVWINEIVSVQKENNQPVNLRGVALDITEQKLAAEQISKMQRELVDASRMAGMAEIATGVLHNVGNVLNSVNISVTLVTSQLQKSKTPSLAKAAQLLGQHKDDVGEFLTHDPKGKQLPAFFVALSEQLAKEQAGLAKEMIGLQQNVEHIKQIVAMQQSYAKVSGAMESLEPRQLVEDALKMSSTAFARHQIEVVRKFEAVPPVVVDRHKVLQILVNLVANAKQALDARAVGRTLTLSISQGDDSHVRVEVSDNGMGIAPENLTRVFQHGFTTKKTGHGFGLHSGANSAKEMGGSLNVRSEGPGTGATFILELPIVSHTTDTTDFLPPPAEETLNPGNRNAACNTTL